MNAPVVPADFKNVIISPTGTFCLAFVKLFLRLPTILHSLVNWMLTSTGAVTAGFRHQLWPVGAVMLSASPNSPVGQWLECNGAAVSRTTYADLFGVISTTYGVGDGSTTFNLPDLRGRAPIGSGVLLNADNSSGDSYSQGVKYGAETVVLTTPQIAQPPTPAGLEHFIISEGSSIGDPTTVTSGGAAMRRATPDEVFANEEDVEGHANVTPVLAMRYWISY